MSPRRLIDLSHTVEDGLVTYPGLPAPVIGLHLSREASRQRYAPGTEFQIDTIQPRFRRGRRLTVDARRA
jgi:arylformamidase